MSSEVPTIATCPNCLECCYGTYLDHGPYDIGGASVTVCPGCEHAHEMEGELPRRSRCKSQQGICSCNDDYLRAKGILLHDGSIQRGYCHECFRKLVPIGSARDGGAPHDDWHDRRYHKACFRKMLQ